MAHQEASVVLRDALMDFTSGKNDIKVALQDRKVLPAGGQG